MTTLSPQQALLMQEVKGLKQLDVLLSSLGRTNGDVQS